MDLLEKTKADIPTGDNLLVPVEGIVQRESGSVEHNF